MIVMCADQQHPVAGARSADTADQVGAFQNLALMLRFERLLETGKDRFDTDRPQSLAQIGACPGRAGGADQPPGHVVRCEDSDIFIELIRRRVGSCNGEACARQGEKTQ